MSKSSSERETQFLSHWRIFGNGTEPERQYRFHPVRQWAFDFAFPNVRLAVEIQGGTAMRGRSGHTSISGMQADYAKYNAAQLRGWRVLLYTSLDLEKRPRQVCQEITLGLLKGVSRAKDNPPSPGGNADGN